MSLSAYYSPTVSENLISKINVKFEKIASLYYSNLHGVKYFASRTAQTLLIRSPEITFGA